MATARPRHRATIRAACAIADLARRVRAALDPRDIQSSREARTMVRSLIDLAHNLEFKVCCEGVETEPALDFLQTAGCDFAQGYFIARPMVAEQLVELAQVL